MIHFMTDVYVFAIERGTRTLQTVPEVDTKDNPVRLCVKAALIAKKVKAKILTFAEVCGESGTVDNGDEFYGAAKDDKDLKDLIVEYATVKKIDL